MTDIPPERPLGETWRGRPLVEGEGADRHADVVVDALWSHGITSVEAARRHGITHRRLASYLRTSEATISRAVDLGQARGLVAQEAFPDLGHTGTKGKVVWLTEKGVKVAPTIVAYNLADAGSHLSAVSGISHVKVNAGGDSMLAPWSSNPWVPQERTNDSVCPHCAKEGRAPTPGACRLHGWASSLIWRD